MKKNLITYMFMVTSMLYSGNLTLYGEKRDIQLLKDDNSQRGLKSEANEEIYYLYGVKSDRTKVVSNGTLVIELEKDTDLKEFAESNNLKFVRENSTGTYIFKNLSNEDIVLVSNRLNSLSETISVTPNWKRERGLK